jgi:hypothetical protein
MPIHILFATSFVYGILIELFAVNFQATTCFGVPLEMLTVIHKFQKFPAFHEPQKAHYHFHQPGHTTAWSVQKFYMGYTVWGSNRSTGEIFHTHPDQSCHPPSLLHDGYWVIPGAKVAGVRHSPSTPTERKG